MKRRQLILGDIMYLNGHQSSMVAIVGNVDKDQVYVKILFEAKERSKYYGKIGRRVYVDRRVLWPKGTRL